MPFKISALSNERFSALRKMSPDQLEQNGVRKLTADACPGYPCRVSLQDAAIGESLYLLNYVHHDEATPYRASHAILVREEAQQAKPATGEVPDVLAVRVISVRAFDSAHDMIDADIVAGSELAAGIAAMLDNDDVDYLHLHYAKPGCFAARVDRA